MTEIIIKNIKDVYYIKPYWRKIMCEIFGCNKLETHETCGYCDDKCDDKIEIHKESDSKIEI